MSIDRRSIICAALLLTIGTGAIKAQVPSEYQPLYDELDSLITDFELRLEAEENQPDLESVTFGVHLPLASSNRGASLLSDDLRYAVQWQLNALKELSIAAVYVEINFPILSLDYHGSEEDYSRYADFYGWLGEQVRLRDMKLIVKTQANFGIFQQPTSPDLDDYYRELTFDEYKQGRMETARTVASLVRPDFLVLQSEPDTEQAATGQPVNELSLSLEMIRLILEELELAGLRTMPIGAGIGTWHPDYLSTAYEYCNSTTIDFLDVHVYPINYDFLERIDSLSEIANNAGKKIAFSELWLYKSSAAELLLPTPSRFISRDPYSFWAPLDSRFLAAMVKLARLRRVHFLSPFWSNYLSAYIDYADAESSTPEAVSLWLAVRSFTNLLQRNLSETGIKYLQAIDPENALIQ